MSRNNERTLVETITDVDRAINLNQRIIVIIPAGPYEGNYVSRIEDIKDNEMFIALPTEKSVAVPVTQGQKIEIEYVNDQGRFVFFTRVRGRVREGRVSMLVVEKPVEVFREQLRDFYRVEVFQKTTLRTNFDVDQGEKIIGGESVPVTMHDISGGGSRITSDTELDNETIVAINLSGLVENMGFVQGYVVRCVAKDEDSDLPTTNRFDLSIEWIIEQEAVRNRIIKYVFKRQIELRQIGGD